MKYLFIFLPFFAFGQDTIVRGHDTMIIGRSYYDNPKFYKEWTRIGKFVPSTDSTLYGTRTDFVASDTCWEIKNGWMSLKPGCAFTPRIEYYDYKEGAVKIKGDSVFRWAKEPEWIPCDQHIGTREMPKRDKIDRTRAKILVWNGCTMVELEVYKINHYNEMTITKDTGNLFAVYTTKTIKVDVVTEYLYDGGWIKNSHVIKEL